MKTVLSIIVPILLMAFLVELGLNKFVACIVMILISIVCWFILEHIETEQKQRQQASKDFDNFMMRYSASPTEQANAENITSTRSPEIDNLARKLKGIIGAPPTYQMMVFAYLAQQGKIPSRGYLNCYASPLSNNHDLINGEKFSELGLYDGIYQDAVIHIRQARLKFLKWYDAELRSHGVWYKLMYVYRNPCDSSFHIKDAEWIAECTHIGKDTAVFWTPIRENVDDLIYVNEYKYW